MPVGIQSHICCSSKASCWTRSSFEADCIMNKVEFVMYGQGTEHNMHVMGAGKYC